MASTNKPTRQEELDAIVANEVMLTTVDNPYNPFLQWREWNAYDVKHGYNSSALLARIAITSNELSEADQALAINAAIDEIVEFNLSGKHIKVTKSDYPKRMSTIRNIALLK